MLVLHRASRCFAILNLYPYNSGHLMVVPYEHVASLEDVDSATRGEMFDLAALTVEAARTVLNCTGFNLGMNLGEHAGAGVAHHIHLHVVPRWVGDANFMPLIGDTMVMPELIPVTYARLRAGLEGLQAQRQHGAVCQAGALVYLPAQRAIVARQTATGELVLPKGHVEAGESSASAAVREVREETGYAAEIIGWAGSTIFEATAPDGQPETRYVAYFLATGTETTESARHLGKDTCVIPLDEVEGSLSIPALRAMVAGVLPTLESLGAGHR
jgi:ATP adenylyltransferase